MSFKQTVYAIAAALFVAGIFYAQPKDDFLTPGKWIAYKDRSSISMTETLLLPGQTSAVKQPRLLSRDQVSGTCVMYEASDGPNSISVKFSVADVVSIGKFEGYEVGESRWSSEPFTKCVFNQTVAFHVTSNTRQVVRIVHYYPSKKKNFLGYQEGLCTRITISRCSNRPLPNINEYYTQEEAAAYNKDKLINGMLISGSSLIVLAGGHPSYLAYILFLLLNTLFPSRKAQRVKEEIRQAASGEKTFNADTTKPYQDASASRFRTKQDINDLQDLIDQTKRENERLRAQEEKAIRDDAEQEKLAAEMEAAVKRVQELQAKLKNMK